MVSEFTPSTDRLVNNNLANPPVIAGQTATSITSSGTMTSLSLRAVSPGTNRKTVYASARVLEVTTGISLFSIQGYPNGQAFLTRPCRISVQAGDRLVISGMASTSELLRAMAVVET